MSSKWRHIPIAVLTLACLGLIIFAGITVWQHPCRADESFSLLISNPSCPPLLLDLEPVLIALCFWTIGLIMWLTGQQTVTIGFFMLGANAAASGKLSAIGSDTGGQLFYLLLAWLSPLTFHFHLAVLERPFGRAERIVLMTLYGLAIIWSLPFLVWTIGALRQRSWFFILRSGIRLTLAASLALTALFLFRDFRLRASPAAQRRIRLIAFGNFLAITPMFLFSLLPDTLGMQTHVPFELTFPWLLLSPLTYCFSLFRPRLVGVEAALNRTAVYFLLVTLLVSVYLAAGVVLHRFTAVPASYWPLTSALLDVALLLFFARLQRGLQRLTNWALYGSEISYVSVIGHVAESLSRTLDREMLRRLLIDELASAMRASQSALFLRDQGNSLILLEAVGFEPDGIAGRQLPGDGNLAAYLESMSKPVADAQLRKALAGVSLHPQEQALLSQTKIALWLPLVSNGVLQGLLLIGPRPEGDFFTTRDERVLATLAHQSGVAAYNVRLTEQFRAGRQELARAHQQLLAGREQEWRRLAQELHDDAVQQLLGVSYQLAQMQPSASGQTRAAEQSHETTTPQVIQQEVLGVVNQLRGLIGELRPAGLEEFGLTDALEGYAARLKREGGPEMPVIELDMDRSGTALPQPVAICLFRVAQEALRNSLKHARARHIKLDLRLCSHEVVLNVRDDGCGFSVPARLSELAQADHFGLLGIAERVTWAGGQFTIRSQVRMGTEVTTRIPLNGSSVR